MDLAESRTQAIEHIIRDAGILLDYSALHAIDVSTDDIKVIVDIGKKYASTQAIDQDEELQLRLAYRALCKVMHPITSESILDSEKMKDGLTLERNPLHLFLNLTTFTLLVFVFAILAQLYWLQGVSLEARLSKRLVDYETLQKQIIALESQRGASDYSAADLDTRYNTMQMVFGELIAEGRALSAWNSVLPFNDVLAGSSRDYRLADVPTKARTDISNARITIVGVAAFLLPSIYGLLGSCIWVIRRRMRQLATSSYTHHSRWLDLTRLSLGPIAGFSIGLLMKADLSDSQITESISLLKNLGPLGLAFVAGYGVEILYKNLDKIVTALTDDRNGEGKA